MALVHDGGGNIWPIRGLAIVKKSALIKKRVPNNTTSSRPFDTMHFQLKYFDGKKGFICLKELVATNGKGAVLRGS